MVENRLLNCQKLEYYYLKKHDEVVRLFTFILNLFDKYKYQGELLLFLLKFLVKRPIDQPNRPGKERTIRIPRAIITNISKLIKDQDSIQKVINKMKDQIIDNPETNLYTPDNNKRNIHDQLVVNSPKSRDTSFEEREIQMKM